MQIAGMSPSDQPKDGTRLIHLPINIIGAVSKGNGSAAVRDEVSRATDLLYEVLRVMSKGRAESGPPSIPGGMGRSGQLPFGFKEIRSVDIGTGGAFCSNGSEIPLPSFSLPVTISMVEIF